MAKKITRRKKKAEKENTFSAEIIESVGRLVFEGAREGKPEECAFAALEMTFADIEKIKKDKGFLLWREKAKVAMTGFLSGEILEAIRIQAKNSKLPEMIPRLSELINCVKSDGTAHNNYQKVAEHKAEEHDNNFSISITIPKEEQDGAETAAQAAAEQ